ncbi:MAG: hypothetical protein COW26_07445 [Nitrosopumilales archaeon CG15_BIG_FIL_POST_REV_8_21_14_020_33_23]|nr:MAG: hypothetical protein COV65_06085 [Nitrosopumilales archaeon CG11_big_fil_rev_8_21_14_0_20_33_24]PIW34404.1 MAG: hypothetical protein COW26_07445 [Nitrosopumilales archaeon CG15_BIG_FIL_POST_REV_8_21_14_020_33_23]
MKITELSRPSILSVIAGLLLTLIGVTVLLNPQDSITNMIFLSMFGIGLFILGLSCSLLYQIRKAKIKS